MGIVDVRRMYGPSMVRRSSFIDIIVSLEESPDALTDAPKVTKSMDSLLGSDIPVIHLAAGVSTDTVTASIVEHIMIEEGATAPVLEALVK
jgi:hypothetical protein